MSAPSPWNAASEIVIDALVIQVKRSRRWSRDGRALRLLNRHWSLAINRRVVAIQPHSSRVLRDKDINSLLKFPNVTSLDVTLFEGKEKALLPEKCTRLAKIIAQLPYLKELQVGRLFEFLDEEQVKAFPPIAGLKFHRDTTGKSWLPLVVHLPLVELIGEFEVKHLNAFMSDIRTLKVLDRAYAVCSSDVDFAEFVSRSKHLRSVSLCCDSEHVGIYVGQLTNLTSLWIYGSDLVEFGPLLELPKQTALSLRFEDGRIFRHPDFKECVSNLGSLEMMGEGEHHHRLRLPNDMLDTSTLLTHLKLESCILSEALIERMEHLPLKRLSLQRCVLPDGFPFVHRLKSLEDFDLEEHPDHDQVEQLDLLPLQNLKRLQIQFGRSKLTSGLLSDIVQLRKLESLTLGNAFEGSANFRFPVTEFEALGDLPDFSRLMLSGPSSKKVAEQFVCLKMLTKLEEFSMRMGIVPCDDVAFIDRELKLLKRIAPHLKLSFSCSPAK